jgi:hypothetical protein
MPAKPSPTPIYAISRKTLHGEQKGCLVQDPLITVMGVAALEAFLAGRLKGAPVLSAHHQQCIGRFVAMAKSLPVDVLPFSRFGNDVKAANRKAAVFRGPQPPKVISRRPVKAHFVWAVEPLSSGRFPSPLDQAAMDAHLDLARKVKRAFDRCGHLLDRLHVNVDETVLGFLPAITLREVDASVPAHPFSCYVAICDEGSFYRKKAFPSIYERPWTLVDDVSEATLFFSKGELFEAVNKKTVFDAVEDELTGRTLRWTILEAPIHFTALAEGMPAPAAYPGLKSLAHQQLDEAIGKDEVRRKLDELDEVRKAHPEWFEAPPGPRVPGRL